MKTVVRMLSAVVGAAPLAVVVVAVAVTGWLGSLIPQRQQASIVDAFAPDSRRFLALERIAEGFGGSLSRVEIILDAGDGDVITASGLELQRRVEEAISASGAARYLDPSAGEPIVGPFTPTLRGLESLGIDPALLDDAGVKRAFALSSDALDPQTTARLAGLFPTVGTDLSQPAAPAGLVLLELAFPDDLGAEEIDAIVTDLEGRLTPLGSDSIAVRVYARALLDANEAIQAQIRSLMRNAGIVIVGILFLVMWVGPAGPFTRLRAMRRTASDTAIAALATAMALVWVVGAEVALGPDGLGVVGYSSSITQVVPVLLIGLGVDYSIHLTSRYREEIADGRSVAGASARATGAVGVALVLGAVTTAVGFLTNVVNPIPTLRDFGVLAALGIAAAFLITLTFAPAVRILLDRRAERRGRVPVEALRRRAGGLTSRVVASAAWHAQRLSVPVVAAAVMTAALGGYALTRLDTRFSLLDFVPDGTPALEAGEMLTDRFSGGFGERTSVLVAGDVGDPATHNALVAALGAVGEIEGVVVLGGRPEIESHVTVLATLADTEPGFASFAASAGMAPDLTFASGGDPAAVLRAAVEIAPDTMAAVLGPDGAGGFGEAVVRITTRAGDEGADRLAGDLDSLFAEVGDRLGIEVTVTSEAIVVAEVERALSGSQAASLAITLAAAMALLVVAFWWEARRPFLGVITILPVGLVVLWTYGMMVAAGIPFSPTTAMVAALAIGIGVDYTIHMVRRFLEDRPAYANLGDAIRSTAAHTGTALTGAALTTLAGFGILVTSSLGPFRELGAVVVFAIGSSLLAAVVTLPAMLALWDRWHRRRDREALERLRGGPTAIPGDRGDG